MKIDSADVRKKIEHCNAALAILFQMLRVQNHMFGVNQLRRSLRRVNQVQCH